MMKSAGHQHLLAQRIFLTIIILKRLAYLLSKTDKGRLIKETDPLGNPIAYTYDSKGNLTSKKDTNSNTITYTYDALNRLTKKTYPDTTTETYTYDADNNILTAVNQHISYTFTYDANNRITSVTDSNNRTITYTYDNISNKLTATDPAENHQYQYDTIYRLTNARHTAVPNEAYTYDPVGNRLKDIQGRSYTYKPGNELLTQNGASFTYDANGNIVTRTSPCGVTNYQYDYENRLIGVTGYKPNCSAITSSYKYDPFGRRIEKSITDDSGIKTTKYLYDREDILYEYSAAGSITNRYIHGPGIDEPLAMARGSNIYYYHADGLGSITAITNNTGTIVQSIRYNSFGNITTISNPSFIQPYAWTGREYDIESGFYYLRNRYYDPRTGRFTTKGPIGFEGGYLNVYGYVGNNPVNFTDPTGLHTYVIIGKTAQGGTIYDVYDDCGKYVGRVNGEPPLVSPEDVMRGIDKAFNNPASEALDKIPPGQPITGNPAVDFYL